MNGKSPGEISGYIAVLGIPWSFKIVNAPFMDRFTYLAMGRRRLWILIGQTGLIISLIIMALISNPVDDLLWLMILGFANSFFTVIQDIAVDGMAVDILPSDQQARANGVMWGSKVVGKSLTVVMGSWMLNVIGISLTMIFFYCYANNTHPHYLERTTRRETITLDRGQGFRSSNYSSTS
jgi:PAT family beta-lactamase induction signal transducer AmpG